MNLWLWNADGFVIIAAFLSRLVFLCGLLLHFREWFLFFLYRLGRTAAFVFGMFFHDNVYDYSSEYYANLGGTGFGAFSGLKHF